MAVDEKARVQGADEGDGLEEPLRRALGEKRGAEVGHEGISHEENAARGEMNQQGILGFAAAHRVQDELGPSHRETLALTDKTVRNDLVAAWSLPAKKVVE